MINSFCFCDRIFGNDGNDFADGNSGDDYINGDAGNDELFGGTGNDQLLGGAGNDKIDGGNGNDFLNGDSGNDSLNGNDGDDSVYGGEGNNLLKGGNGIDTLIGGSSSDIFVISPSSGLDNIVYFQGDRDYFGLTQDLTFNQLQIVQGGENYTNDVLISIAGTDEHLALVKDTQISAIDSSSNTSLLSTTTAPITLSNSTTTAPISQLNSTTTASISLQNSTTTAPATISLQPLTTATNPGSLTVTSATTTTDDILLNGGSIPTMNSFSGIDDDILIYDSNSLLTSLTSAQTQPIIPLQAASVSSAIEPTANTYAMENLLLNANPSPIQLPTNSDINGTSSVK